MTTTDSTCAYCGATEIALTRDHVVPRAFWKDADMPPHPITVPACRPCQAHWDSDTTYFRNMLVVQSAPELHPAVMRLATGAIRRRINKSLPDLLDITRNAAPAWQHTRSGLLTQSGVKIEIDITRFQRTPEKIIRGLFYLRNSAPVPLDYDVRIVLGNDFWEDRGFNRILDKMHDWEGLGDDLFQVRATRDVNDPNFTVWLMAFFRSSALFGYTCPSTY